MFGFVQRIYVFLAVFFSPFLVWEGWAADGLDGRFLSPVWALPFGAILLAIATGPLFFARTWEHHYGKITAGFAAFVVVGLLAGYGVFLTRDVVLHVILLEYMSFIILLFALFTISGGILITGNLHASPLLNVGILTAGTLLASVVGTTGASMMLIRPLIRANDHRPSMAHVVVFFIFLVSNIGGALSPLGDPPLFLGFLRGVDFFWPTKHLAAETAILSLIVLVVFFCVDHFFERRDRVLPAIKDKTPDRAMKVYGQVNFLLLAMVIAVILAAASWKSPPVLSFWGTKVEVNNLMRDGALLLLAAASLFLTPRQVRAGNAFSWGPILEVAKIFFSIFIAMIPVLAMLKAGKEGAFGALVALVNFEDGTPNNAAYFWLTGLLSSFLDNAPTYLVFFELAGGDPVTLMGSKALTLAAISAGAVFMGANSYIGNAPNFMVYAIAKDSGVKMPSFFGYMLWSFAVLIPSFVVITLVFFR